MLLFKESNVEARRLSGRSWCKKKNHTKFQVKANILKSFTQPLSLAYQQTLTLKRRNTCWSCTQKTPRSNSMAANVTNIAVVIVVLPAFLSAAVLLSGICLGFHSKDLSSTSRKWNKESRKLNRRESWLVKKVYKKYEKVTVWRQILLPLFRFAVVVAGAVVLCHCGGAHDDYGRGAVTMPAFVATSASCQRTSYKLLLPLLFLQLSVLHRLCRRLPSLLPLLGRRSHYIACGIVILFLFI